MSDNFIAEIRAFPFNFPPSGWALCNGQLLAVSQYSALFSLLGTSFGGDGRATFGLPNLQGAVAVDQGQGAGLSQYVIGQAGGAATVTLQPLQNGVHTHPLNGDAEASTTATPANAGFQEGRCVINGTPTTMAAYSTKAPDTALNGVAIQPAGSNVPHNNMMPYVAMTYCIALTGEFPQRS
jgi:microcystin-dependent protein